MYIKIVMIIIIIIMMMEKISSEALPVVIMHGVLDDYTTMDPLIDMIHTALGADVPVISFDINNMFDFLYSISAA